MKQRNFLAVAAAAALLVTSFALGALAASPEIPSSALRSRFFDAAPSGTVPSSFFGVHENLLAQTDSEADLATEISRIRELNLGVLRFSISWNRLFDTGAGCSRNVARPESVAAMNALLARLPGRVEVLGMLTQPPQPCVGLYKVDRAAFRRQYADYVTQAVKLFKHRVHAWDVWNEPNGSGFYLDPAGRNMWTIEEYFQDVFYPGASTVRRLDPKATIVLASAASNGVGGHRCRPNGMLRGRPCPPPRGGGWYMRPNFLPDLFAYFNAHPEFKPYSLFDKVGLHPYYWTLFGPGGERFRRLTFVPPSVQTYGPGGLVASLPVPRGENFGLWWTELNEKLRLSLHNTLAEQAKRFHSILEQALVDSRRKAFPLQLVTWFSLRDNACPKRARSCMSRDRDASGRKVRHLKWNGLIAYGEGGQPQSHIPRKVFYTYKDFVADHTHIDYLIDDFTSKSVNNEAFDPSFWEASCTALNRCDSLFAGPTSGDLLRMQAPGKSYGPWTKVALASRHHIEIAGKERVSASFDFALPASTDGNAHYAQVSLGRRGSAAKELGAFVLLLQRSANGELGAELLERTSSGGLRPLAPWSLVAKQCSSPVGKGLNHADLMLGASGSWELAVADAGSGKCLALSSSSTGKRHALSFKREGSLALVLTGLSQAGGGEFDYDNVRLEGLEKGEH